MRCIYALHNQPWKTRITASPRSFTGEKLPLFAGITCKIWAIPISSALLRHSRSWLCAKQASCPTEAVRLGYFYQKATSILTSHQFGQERDRLQECDPQCGPSPPPSPMSGDPEGGKSPLEVAPRKAVSFWRGKTVKQLTTVHRGTHFTRSDATGRQGSKVVFKPIMALLGASKSKQAGGHPPIPLRPARTTLALTRFAKQASNDGAIELLPGTTKGGHKGSCRAAREPEEPPVNLRKPEEGAYLGEGHPCRRARMVESPVRLMQPGCLRSSAGMPAPQAGQVSAKPRIGQGGSRVLRRKWPVSRTPPCISSAPCPILPTWRYAVKCD